MGHLLQLVYGDVLLKDDDVDRFNTLMYTHMTNHRSGQSGCYFKEVAMELNHAVLTNKSKQESRWVRSELRSLQAWYRNLPTIIHIISSEEEEACRSGNATLQKQLEKELKHLRDPKMIAFGIGL